MAAPTYYGNAHPAGSPVFDVMYYGAKGDGVTDDSTALAAALSAAAGGGVVYLPAGTFLTSQSLTIPAGVILCGSGSASILQITTDNALLLVGASDWVQIRDLQLQSKSPTSSTTAIGATSSTNLRIDNVKIFGNFNGVVLTSAQSAFIRNLSVTLGANGGNGIQINGGNDHYISSSIISGWSSGSPSNTGILIQSSNGSWFENVDCIYNTNALQILPNGNTAIVQDCFFTGCAFDSSVNDCVLLQTASGGKILELTFVNCWTANSTNQSGVNIADSGTDGVQFIGHRAVHNSNNGIVLNGGKNVVISGGLIAGNSKGTSGAANGVLIQGGVSDVLVTNSRIGQAGGEGATQGYGVTLGTGSVTNVVVSQCDLTGNSGASLRDLSNAAGSKFFSGNLGYNPLGASVAQPSVGASPWTYTNNTGVAVTLFVTGGTVSAITIDGQTTGLTSGTLRIPPGKSSVVTYTVAPTVVAIGD